MAFEPFKFGVANDRLSECGLLCEAQNGAQLQHGAHESCIGGTLSMMVEDYQFLYSVYSPPHPIRCSIDFDVTIDSVHKLGRAGVSKSSTHHTECECHQRAVAEIERSLEDPEHLCLEEEVIRGVQIDIDRRARA
jgi:hypothetical protein